jgi:hypothetical protein
MGVKRGHGTSVSTEWRKTHPEAAREHSKKYAPYRAGWRAEVKLETLSHYGPNGECRCSWEGCNVDDIDVLTLDHVADDGAKERRNSTGAKKGVMFYSKLRTNGFPRGYQTLCANHQLKKLVIMERESQ